ncbi:UbiA family prenyltransferase [Roseofilum sp. BLCC_M154]|uniref:UbiA family prenyltransferase n=1 Tax=Roseofilum acuticapitatum BLCC-M154 TaxID=3022444 RepID=A0ABT7AUG3_9CYAN|nr:UbiA family prenyltransferase [Roseofilum acuticapitatum]MDJ1170552.1 UbiA family prenyltransferase [Roseofilum acuticapitatum BLCC-M154]
MKKKHIHKIYDRNYAQNYNQRFLLNDLSKIDADFEQETIAQLLDEIGDNPQWLDVACGTGYFLSCFPEIKRAGLDISPAMLETARQANPSIPLIQGDYRDKRPEWESKWDLISCMFWAYCYVESFSELELVVANFANWTSERGVCFLPVCDPAELRHGEIVLPYTSRNMGAGGGLYRFEGIIWSWIDEEFGKHHLNLIVPQPEYMLSLFGKFFEDVKIINYAIFNGAQRKAIVARSKKRRIDNPKANLNIQKLIRSQEWWLYKIAPLLTIAYAETLLLQLPPTTATLTTLTALLSITSVAAYGYLLNDICDIETDQKANKPNAAAQLQPWQRLLLCLLFLSIGFAAPLLTHLGTIPLALLTANYLLPTLYSVPPLRLKERGIWGILSDAAGAHLVPTLFVAAPLLSQTPDPPRNALLFTGIAATHAFFVGLRGILLHQLWDRANDLNAGITTFVTQRQPETVQRWINRLVFPVELLLLGGVL